MYVHLTNTQVIIFGFAFVLIIILTLAAFLGNCLTKGAPLCDFGSNNKLNSFRRSFRRDDKDRMSDLHTRYADLSARGLNTVEQCITFRRKTKKIPVGVDPTAVLSRTAEWIPTLAPSPRHSVEPDSSNPA